MKGAKPVGMESKTASVFDCEAIARRLDRCNANPAGTYRRAVGRATGYSLPAGLRVSFSEVQIVDVIDVYRQILE